MLYWKLFHDEKNMSAGVAVKLYKRFGRPKPSYCINQHLACQKTNNNSAVFYELLTKDKYSGMPFLEDYNKAFKSLTEYFNSKKLKDNFCYPMGYIRDKISVEHFVLNFRNIPA